MKVTIGNAIVYIGDALTCLQQMESESVQCCVTSPPYFGLRDYQVDGQIGLERTVDEYIDKLVQVFREVRRVLKKDGTFWLVIGDSYSGYHGNSKVADDKAPSNKPGYIENMRQSTVGTNGLKPKDLIGIPWRIALALHADGWWLRSDTIEEQIWICPCCDKEMILIRRNCDRDIIWKKPGCKTESVKDRPTKSHEYIFLFAKNQRYYYDAEAIKEPTKYPNDNRAAREKKYSEDNFISRPNPKSAKTYKKKNKRSVWTVSTRGFPGAHFATFPPALIEPCILAGSKPGDIILDPFFGSGTTGEVALKHSRKVIGIELNPDYRVLWEKRVKAAQRQLRLCEVKG